MFRSANLFITLKPLIADVFVFKLWFIICVSVWRSSKFGLGNSPLLLWKSGIDFGSVVSNHIKLDVPCGYVRMWQASRLRVMARGVTCSNISLSRLSLTHSGYVYMASFNPART